MFNALTIVAAAVDAVSSGTFAASAVSSSEPAALVLFGATLYSCALVARRVIRRREQRRGLAPLGISHHAEPAV